MGQTGGFLIMLVPRRAFDNEMVHYTLLDWQFFKLQRVSWSSLNSEAQTAAIAVNSLEYTK
eukprot:3092954-Prorocentrum_lima.AAC.1